MNDDFKEELKDCYAEIESLRFQLNGVIKMRNEAESKVERLRAALYKLVELAEVSDDCQYGTLSTAVVRDIANAALAEEKK